MQDAVGLFGVVFALVVSVIWYAVMAEIAAKFIFRTEAPNERAKKSIAAAIVMDLIVRAVLYFLQLSLFGRLFQEYDFLDVVIPVAAIVLAYLWVRSGFRKKWVPDEDVE